MMPRYFFDIHDEMLATDDIGTLLDDDEAAVRQAVLTLPEIASNGVVSTIREKSIFIVVRTEEKRTVYVGFLSYGGTLTSKK